MAAVIDTNVILVANEAHAGVSPDCVLTCVDRLLAVSRQGRVVIDDCYRILSEYQNKSTPRTGKKAGDVFVKWLLQNAANTARVEQVQITETQLDNFAEFPDQDLQAEMDPADRKFIAVAAAHPEHPPVWQATDCKWLDVWPQLQGLGIVVEFLCPDDIRSFYCTKFPGQPLPQI